MPREHKVHPEKKCQQCGKCGSLSALRWRHLNVESEDKILFIKQKFGIDRTTCLCNKCYLELIKIDIDGPPPEKKAKVDKCFVCTKNSEHSKIVKKQEFLDKYMLIPSNECNDDGNLSVLLCSQHFTEWNENDQKDQKEAVYNDYKTFCAVPSCNQLLPTKLSEGKISDFEVLEEHFWSNNEEWFSSLNKDSKICHKCRVFFYKIRSQIKPSTNNPSLLQIIRKLMLSIKRNNTSDQVDKEKLALDETLVFLAFHLQSDSPIFLSQVFDNFKEKLTEYSFESNRSSQWLKYKIEQTFQCLIQFHSYDNNGSIDTRKGTLILRKNANVANILHDVCFRNLRETSNQNDTVTDLTKTESSEGVSTETAYQVVIKDISSRYQGQVELFKKRFQNIDLSKLDLIEIAKSIDPYIWNFHYLASQTKREWRDLNSSFPILNINHFPNRQSVHFQHRIHRTLFSICHTLFQVSSGECNNPLHVLLSDAIDSYSGSTKLSSLLNGFGLVASKPITRDHIQKIVNLKNASKFVDDLNHDAFTVVSIDNIDVGQPNASVTLGFQNRGIHATSYQAVQPKPISLLYSETSVTPYSHIQELIDDTPFYKLRDVEKRSLSEFSNSTFEYMLDKKSIQNTPHYLPNLKCHLSKFNDPKTEKANVAYLGVVNEPCDNTETIKHVLEKIHETFDTTIQNKCMVLVGDGKTYDLICKLKLEYSQELQWVVPFPGDWHILKNTQPVLFKIYFEAGLHEIAKITHKEDGLLTILQQCSNFRKTHSFLLHAWESFYQAELNAFFEYRAKDNTITKCGYSNEEILKSLLNFILDSSENDSSPEQLSENRNALQQCLQLNELKGEFDTFCSKMCQVDDTFRFWHDFVHNHCLSYVALYIAFRSSNWNLRLSALKQLAPLFHAFDRHMYLRLIPRHLKDIAEMPYIILQNLQNGGFTATKTGNSWQQLALDEAHESYINLDVKSSVQRPSPELLDTMSVYLPYRASLQHNLYSQLHAIKDISEKENKGFSNSNMKNDHAIISEYLVKVTESKVFDCSLNSNRGLIQLFTENKAEGSLSYDMMNFYDIGSKSLEIYIKTRILKEPSTQAPVRKHTLKTFAAPVEKKKVKKVSESSEKIMYNRCIKKEMAFSINTGNPLRKFHQYIPLPRAICNADGTINHQDTKSNALKHLCSRYNDLLTDEIPTELKPHLVVLEGMFIINSAPIRSHHKTFYDHLQYLARRWILPHIKADCKEVHVVFDRPGAMSNDGSPTLKDLERSRRDDKNEPPKTKVNVSIAADLPKSKWIEFLRNRENKSKYIQLFGEHFLNIVESFLKDQVCILNGCFEDGNAYGIYHGGSIFQVQYLTSNHEESDTLLWLHTLRSNHKNIMIFSPDTDIVFIGMSFVEMISSEKSLFIQMNVLGENVKYLNFSNLVDSISRDPDLGGIPRCHVFKCLQVLYISSGCDYLSFFRGYGKAMFLSTFFQYAQFICGDQDFAPGFLSETKSTDKVSGFLSFIRLIGCLYFKKNATEFLPNHKNPIEILKDVKNEQDQTIPCRKLHEEWLSLIRNKVQVRASYEDEVPPSASALEYHWLRTCLVSQMYDQANKNNIILPPFNEYGYECLNDKLTPVWDDKQHIKSVENRVKWLLRGCKCKKGCIKNNCSCKKNKQLCGPGCTCLNCQNCDSPNKCCHVELEETENLTAAESGTDDESE